MISPWNYFFLFASIFVCFASSLSSIPYNDHCSAIVPQSEVKSVVAHTSIPEFSVVQFTGGENLIRHNRLNITFYKSLKLRIGYNHYETEDEGIYQVQGTVTIRSPRSFGELYPKNYTTGGSYYRRNRARGLIRFKMVGFWSEKTRKLCMVGSAHLADDSAGGMINFDAVIKLKFASETNPTIYASVVSGTLESTISDKNDAGYFDPISMFSYPDILHYNYSIIPKLVGKAVSGDYDKSLKLESNQFCSMLGWRSIYMDLKCGEEHEYCSPFGARVLSFTPTGRCLEYDTKLRFTAKFINTTYDDGNFLRESTLIGEAGWDGERNELIGGACRLLDPLSHFGDVVGDCSMRLSLRYPSILTIKNDSKIAGRIWSSKSANESGYFKSIDLSSSAEEIMPFPGPKYEFTEMDRVRKSCEKKPKKKGAIYPDGYSYNMRFDMSIKNKKTGDAAAATGFATPLFVGGELYQGSGMTYAALSPSSSVVADAISAPVSVSPVNISYRITINPFNVLGSRNWNNMSMNHNNEIVVNAEGFYSAETGYLCMTGCRKLVRNSMDCEVLVKIQFPSFRARGEVIEGTIRSTRARTDPLHFNDLFLKSAAYYLEAAEQSIWRMDLEITLVLISNTLACVFIGLQIFHVKRNPEVSSFVSVVMLLILSVGHMIPLMLNFDALFLGEHSKQSLLLSNGGRVEANEVAVRVITMVAFLMQVRLLQLVWSSKNSDVNREKKAGFVSLLLYTLGGVVTLVLNWIKNRYIQNQLYSLWGDLRSYAGLILDGFLLPQIVLNVFVGSAEKALSGPFYVGTSVVRLVPHAYNQYRIHNYPRFDLNTTYYYANPEADFYSTAWDIVIPCGVIVLAIVVFFQQRHGGRCVLPKRVKELVMYEKVPAVEDIN